jgi:hypothetical protein
LGEATNIAHDCGTPLTSPDRTSQGYTPLAHIPADAYTSLMLRPTASTYKQAKRRGSQPLLTDPEKPVDRELGYLADWAASKTRRRQNTSACSYCMHRRLGIQTILFVIGTCIFIIHYQYANVYSSNRDHLKASTDPIQTKATSLFYVTTTLDTVNETMEEYTVSTRTGSFQNCTTLIERQKFLPPETDLTNILSDVVYISCLPIRYRIPLGSLQRAAQAQTDIIVGILSNAGADGPMRRQVIRHTWASNDTFTSTLTKDLILQQIENTTLQAATAALDDPSPLFLRTKAGVFFLVAGTWTDQLSKEFQLYRDLIWIDQAEVYDVEKSVLTYKTQSFASIVHREMKKFEETGGYKYSYLFKTDDDSYVNLRYLHYELIERKRMTPIYPLSVPFMWGICTYIRRKPLRDLKYKWSISLESYPEEFYPSYCEGAGFALSRTLVDCMVDEDHIAQMRFMPFEDVSMGMLAERCHVELFVNAHELIHLYRTGYPYGSAQEYSRVDLNLGRLPDGDWLPEANMTGRIVQHRINSDVDMIEHHLKMLSSFYYDYYQDKY